MPVFVTYTVAPWALRLIASAYDGALVTGDVEVKEGYVVEIHYPVERTMGGAHLELSLLLNTCQVPHTREVSGHADSNTRRLVEYKANSKDSGVIQTTIDDEECADRIISKAPSSWSQLATYAICRLNGTDTDIDINRIVADPVVHSKIKAGFLQKVITGTGIKNANHIVEIINIAQSVNPDPGNILCSIASGEPLVGWGSALTRYHYHFIASDIDKITSALWSASHRSNYHSQLLNDIEKIHQSALSSGRDNDTALLWGVFSNNVIPDDPEMLNRLAAFIEKDDHLSDTSFAKKIKARQLEDKACMAASLYEDYTASSISPKSIKL